MMIFTKFGHMVRPLLVLPFECFRKIYITQNVLEGGLRGHKGAIG